MRSTARLATSCTRTRNARTASLMAGWWTRHLGMETTWCEPALKSPISIPLPAREGGREGGRA
eukprot:804419-Rhodomonas_salina.1